MLLLVIAVLWLQSTGINLSQHLFGFLWAEQSHALLWPQVPNYSPYMPVCSSSPTESTQTPAEFSWSRDFSMLYAKPSVFSLLNLPSFLGYFRSRLESFLLYTMARWTIFDANAKRSTVQGVKYKLIPTHSHHSPKKIRNTDFSSKHCLNS